jgi:hypothetical protein
MTIISVIETADISEMENEYYSFPLLLPWSDVMF